MIQPAVRFDEGGWSVVAIGTLLGFGLIPLGRALWPRPLQLVAAGDDHLDGTETVKD